MSELRTSVATSLKPAGKYAQLWREIVKNRAIYLFISPFYILFAIFGLFPIAFSLYLSFNKWDGIGDMKFTGLNQFRYMLTDVQFWKAIRNTLEIWIYSTIPMLFFALLIAFLLNSAFLRYRTLYRIAYFLPNVTSIVAVAIIFGTLFGNKYGFLNFILTSFGLDPVEWLNSPFWIKIAIASMVVWRWTGYRHYIYRPGCRASRTCCMKRRASTGEHDSDVLPHYGPAAEARDPVYRHHLDDRGMQIFTESQVLVGNGGGPGGEGMTIVLYLYQLAFVKYLFGYASTVAWDCLHHRRVLIPELQNRPETGAD